MTLIPSFRSPFEFDSLLLEPCHAIMETGILIDRAKQTELQGLQMEEWNKAQETLNGVAGWNMNAGSPKQAQRLLYDEIGITKRTRKDLKTKKVRVVADEEAIRSIMAECRGKVDHLKQEAAKERYMRGYVACHYILKIRGIRKQLSSYLGVHIDKGQVAGFSSLTDDDGRIRGTLSVGGTETARFSHSKTLWDTGVNLATVPRKLRSMYIADDGYELAQFDLNRGESWIYSHLSEDPELLRIHTKGLDFHAETASTISIAYGDPLTVDWIISHEKTDDRAYKIRYLGKRTNHATSYRMGPYKGAEVVNSEAEETGITATVAQVKTAQGLWHQKYFMVKGKWWPEIEKQLGDNRTLITPYGRVHTFHDHFGDSLYKSATAYVPQSTSVDYLNRGLLKVYHLYQKTDTWGLKILTQTHDSILVMYRSEYREEAIPAIAHALKSELTIKRRTFSIPVDAEYGPSWGTMTKYKLAA